MSHEHPVLEDYLRLFQRYGEDLDSIYREPEDDHYEFLFTQCVRLLNQPSPFNRSLPEPFRTSARRYRDGEPTTRAWLEQPANRHFMLCDLHDYIKLKANLAKRREQG